jgi:hypothetical protein
LTGGSSTPRLLDSITNTSEYWIARSSRATTAEDEREPFKHRQRNDAAT